MAERRDEDLRRLQSALDDVGSSMRADLDRAAEMTDAPGEERVLDVLVREKEATLPPRRRVLGPIVAAAAVVVLFVLSRALLDGDTREDDRILGGAPTLVEPVGEVDGFEVFRWECSLERGGWFEIRVHDGTREGSDRELKRAEVQGNQWEPPIEEVTEWPREIRWEVTPHDADGRAGVTRSARASRSSPSSPDHR